MQVSDEDRIDLAQDNASGRMWTEFISLSLMG
jgi:hypothetical protein